MSANRQGYKAITEHDVKLLNLLDIIYTRKLNLFASSDHKHNVRKKARKSTCIFFFFCDGDNIFGGGIWDPMNNNVAKIILDYEWVFSNSCEFEYRQDSLSTAFCERKKNKLQ